MGGKEKMITPKSNLPEKPTLYENLKIEDSFTFESSGKDYAFNWEIPVEVVIRCEACGRKLTDFEKLDKKTRCTLCERMDKISKVVNNLTSKVEELTYYINRQRNRR